jgi:hypothetical protein
VGYSFVVVTQLPTTTTTTTRASSGAFWLAAAAKANSDLDSSSSNSNSIHEELDDETWEILRVATSASKRAGDIIRANSGGADVVEKKSTSRDLLTLIDPQCEKVSQHTQRSPVWSECRL